MDPKKTADELAAEAAEQMFKSGGRSAMVGQPITQQHAQAAPSPDERAPTAEEIAKAKGGAGGMPTTTAAATGGFTSTAGGKVLDKAETEEEEEEKEEGEEEAEKGKTCKSEGDVDEDALMKSMDALDAAAAGAEEPELDRRAELAKALEDGTLSDEDREELMTLLGADQPAPASDAIHKSESEVVDDLEPVDKGFDDVFSEEFAEDYDVSPFLEKFGTAVGAGMDIMREDLAKSAQNQQRFNTALAKSFRGVATVIQRQGEMIKSLNAQNQALATRLGIVEQQPVGRKSAATPTQAQPIQKSFAGQDPDEIGLSREQIFQGLHMLMQKYKTTGGRAANGEPIDRAVSSFELSGRISKSLLSEVKSELTKSQQ